MPARIRLPTLAVLALSGLLSACGSGIDPEGSYSPLECPNFTLEREPMIVSVSAAGTRVRLGPNRNWLDFPAGAVEDGARYRITRSLAGGHVLFGVTIEPVGGAPAAFAPPVEVRFNYSKCEPHGSGTPSGLLRSSAGGAGWQPEPGSRRALLRREVTGRISGAGTYAVAS